MIAALWLRKILIRHDRYIPTFQTPSFGQQNLTDFVKILAILP